jgi:hypothetical protein
MEGKMNESELLKYRKDTLKEIQALELKSKKLSNMIGDLKKEKTTVNEAYPKIIQACQQFLDGLIEEEKVKHGLREFTKVGRETNIDMLVSDIEKIQNDIQQEIKQKNDSLISVERQLWKMVFEALKTELHDKSRDLIEKIAVAGMNSGQPGGDFNYLFMGIFGKFRRGPSQEMKNSFEKEVRSQWR